MKRSRAGFTLLEVLIAAAVSAVVFAAVFGVVFTAVRQDEQLRVQMELQLESTRALKDITSMLKMSGPIDANRNGVFNAGDDWPIFATDELEFEPRPKEGEESKIPPGNFAAPLTPINIGDTNPDNLRPALTPPYKLTRKDDPVDFPENQASVEIAFRLPEDGASGAPDGYPTDANGGIEWSSDIYVICHEARSPVEWIENGNVLELRRYDSTTWKLKERRTLAHWVERVLIESKNASFYQTGNYDTSLGQDQLRITVWFRRNDVSRQRARQVTTKVVSTVLFRSVDR